MQNLPLPHIRTGDVFFARQLWMYVFGIHDIGRNKVCMNLYLKSEGKKGQCDVTSLLLKYFNEHSITSEHLIIFSDGCPGQNKNYLMVIFLYILVHVVCLFKSVKYVFPIRGHSYLPNKQDFALIGNLKKKHTIETPEEWEDLIKTARKHPSPFEVKSITPDMFFDLKKALEPYFIKTCKPATKIKDARMIKIDQESPFVLVKYNFTGEWTRIHVRTKRPLPSELNFSPLYKAQIPLNPNIVKDIQRLKHYLSDPYKMIIYDKLCEIVAEEGEDIDIDNEDVNGGEE